jgi:tetratricopeptide (TPR) repeat protein
MTANNLARRSGAARLAPLAVGIATAVLWSAVTHAQPAVATRADDLEDLVRAGAAEKLEARFGKRPSVDERRLIARAAANYARNLPPGEARAAAFEAAAERYRAWVQACEKIEPETARVHTVRLAAARAEYAGMLLSGPAAALLDEIELSAGQRGNAAEARRLLAVASTEYERALSDLEPLAGKLRDNEEELLSSGIYDTLSHTRRDALLNGAWTRYSLGTLDPQEEARRRHFVAAQQLVRQVLESGAAGGARHSIYMLLGMAQRELNRPSEAEKSFEHALGEGAPLSVAVRTRYELARLLLTAGRFDEARTALEPLAGAAPKNAAAQEPVTRFYANLAAIWHAHSYLLEANAIQAQPATDSTARAAVQQKSRRTRDQGLARFRELAARGGPWPGVV